MELLYRSVKGPVSHLELKFSDGANTDHFYINFEVGKATFGKHEFGPKEREHVNICVRRVQNIPDAHLNALYQVCKHWEDKTEINFTRMFSSASPFQLPRLNQLLAMAMGKYVGKLTLSVEGIHCAELVLLVFSKVNPAKFQPSHAVTAHDVVLRIKEVYGLSDTIESNV